MNIQKARREFRIMIDRCGCSRASIRLTQEEIDKVNTDGSIRVEPVEPSCTPSRCFPELYQILYPKGGFSGKSNALKVALARTKQEMERRKK